MSKSEAKNLLKIADLRENNGALLNKNEFSFLDIKIKNVNFTAMKIKIC